MRWLATSLNLAPWRDGVDLVDYVANGAFGVCSEEHAAGMAPVCWRTSRSPPSSTYTCTRVTQAPLHADTGTASGSNNTDTDIAQQLHNCSVHTYSSHSHSQAAVAMFATCPLSPYQNRSSASRRYWVNMPQPTHPIIPSPPHLPHLRYYTHPWHPSTTAVWTA